VSFDPLDGTARVQFLKHLATLCQLRVKSQQRPARTRSVFVLNGQVFETVEGIELQLGIVL